MGLFYLSDLLIASTLFLNALALIASPPKVSESLPLAAPATATAALVVGGGGSEVVSCQQYDLEALQSSLSAEDAPLAEVSLLERWHQLLRAARRLSCLIVFWNLFFSLLMVFVLPA